MKPCRICGGLERYKSGECKACAKKRNKIRRDFLKANDPEGYKELCKARYDKAYKRKKLIDGGWCSNLRKYGLTLTEYNSMYDAQSGCCFICGKHQKDLKYKLAVDHCHKTGKVRALLCPKCNNAVAMYELYSSEVRQYLEIFK